MSQTRNCWTHLCVATSATALLTGVSASQSFATQHVLQPGETLSAVARRYHVSIHDLQTTNHLTNVDSVADFTRLVIPPPPPRIKVHAYLHKMSTVKGDSVSLRLGPDSSFRRMAYLNTGDTVVITAHRGEWVQARTDTGATGWLRADYLHANSAMRAEGSERSSEHSRHEHTHAVARAVRVHRRTTEFASHRSHAVAASNRHVVHHRLVVHHRSQREPYGGRGPVGGGTDLVRSGLAYRGTPYVYGGAGRGGFDCSGFTSYLYSRHGVALPHSARAQFQMGRHVGRGEMSPGDLVFFHTVTPGISHVGMYLGNGKFVHASSRRAGGVRVDNLDGGYYSHAFRGATHISHH